MKRRKLNVSANQLSIFTKMNKTKKPVEAVLFNVRNVLGMISVQSADLVTFLMKKKARAAVLARI